MVTSEQHPTFAECKQFMSEYTANWSREELVVSLTHKENTIDALTAHELYILRADAHKVVHGDFPEDGVGLMVECLDDAENAYRRLLDEAAAIDAAWTDVKQRRDAMRASVA